VGQPHHTDHQLDGLESIGSRLPYLEQLGAIRPCAHSPYKSSQRLACNLRRIFRNPIAMYETSRTAHGSDFCRRRVPTLW
jgi:hypothetical protein